MTNFADTVTHAETRRQLLESAEKFAMSPADVARAIAYAIEQPNGLGINEIVLRSTAQA
jgi:NADP-dependent 3-hydroxy acid dehydrogenase YdfG